MVDEFYLTLHVSIDVTLTEKQEDDFVHEIGQLSRDWEMQLDDVLKEKIGVETTKAVSILS